MRFLCICVAFVSWLGFTSAWAAEQTSNNVLDKHLTIFGGIQSYQAKGQFRSTKEGRPQINIDLDDVGLNENEVTPIAGVVYNFGKRWNLRFEYFGYHDDGKETAEFSFDFDDVIIPVGARVDSSLDLDVYALNLTYNFIHSERLRFGVGVGIHVADFDLKISGKATVAGNEISLGEDKEDFLAPLPNLYASGAYAFTERFIVRFGGGWMSLSISDYDGSLYFANAFLEYWPFQYVGFGAGYRYLEVDVDYNPGNKEETYNVELPGPLFYVALGF